MQEPLANPVFQERFLKESPSQIAKKIAEDGFYVFEGAIRRMFLDGIDGDLGSRPLGVNVNDVAPIRYHNQFYFVHSLAASKDYFNLVTHPHLRSIAREYLGKDFRLKCQRYYQSHCGFELPWHTDNQTSEGKNTDIRGLGVVIYVKDTYEGELQVIRGSHRWSGATKKNSFSNGEAMSNNPSDCLHLRYRAGTIIFFDTYTLHRTRAITIKDHVRRSIFLQIDADLSHSEKTILNPEFLNPKDSELLQYLGVGLPSGYPVMPPSSLDTMSDRDLAGLSFQSARILLKRFLKSIVNQRAAS